MKNKIFAFTIALLMAFGMILHDSHAAASTKTIKLNSSYQVKLNGTSKQLKITPSYDSDGAVSMFNFYVNGAKTNTFSLGNYQHPDISIDPLVIKLINLNNKKSFILITNMGGTDAECTFLFQYKDNQFKMIMNLNTIPGLNDDQEGDFCEGIEVKKVSASGNKLKVSYMVYGLWDWGERMDYTMTYAYKSGTLKRTSNNVSSFKFYDNDGDKVTSLKTKTSVKILKSAGGSKVYYTVPKGKKVSVKGLWIKSGKVYLKVAYNKKTGWINMLKTDGSKAFYRMGDWW